MHVQIGPHGDARYDTRFLRSVGEGDANSVPGETQEQTILTSHGELDDAIHDTPTMTRIRRGAVVCCDSY